MKKGFRYDAAWHTEKYDLLTWYSDRDDHICKNGKYDFLYHFIMSYFSVFKQCHARQKDFFQHNAKSHKIKLRKQSFFPRIKILLGTAAFYLIANLIWSVRVKWLLLRSVRGIDGTLDEVNDFTFAIYFHSSQFCVASSCLGHVVHTSNFTWNCQRPVQYAVTCTALLDVRYHPTSRVHLYKEYLPSLIA